MLADITADNWLERYMLAREIMGAAVDEYERIRNIRNDLIVAADKAGKTRAEIANMFGISESAIYVVLKKRALQKDKRKGQIYTYQGYNDIIEYYKGCGSIYDTAKAFGVPTITVVTALGHHERSTGQIMRERGDGASQDYDGGDQAGD